MSLQALLNDSLGTDHDLSETVSRSIAIDRTKLTIKEVLAKAVLVRLIGFTVSTDHLLRL